MPQPSVAETVENIQNLTRQITASGQEFEQTVADLVNARREVENIRDEFRRSAADALQMLEELRGLQEDRLEALQNQIGSAVGEASVRIEDAFSRSRDASEGQRALQAKESAALRDRLQEQVDVVVAAGRSEVNERVEALEARYAKALVDVHTLTVNVEHFDQTFQQALDRQASAWNEFLKASRARLEQETQAIPEAVRLAAAEAAQKVSLRVEAQLIRIEGTLISQKQRVEAAEQGGAREKDRLATLARRVEAVNDDVESLVHSVRDLSKSVSAQKDEANSRFDRMTEELTASRRRWWRKQGASTPGERA